MLSEDGRSPAFWTSSIALAHQKHSQNELHKTERHHGLEDSTDPVWQQKSSLEATQAFRDLLTAVYKAHEEEVLALKDELDNLRDQVHSKGKGNNIAKELSMSLLGQLNPSHHEDAQSNGIASHHSAARSFPKEPSLMESVGEVALERDCIAAEREPNSARSMESDIAELPNALAIDLAAEVAADRLAAESETSANGSAGNVKQVIFESYGTVDFESEMVQIQHIELLAEDRDEDTLWKAPDGVLQPIGLRAPGKSRIDASFIDVQALRMDPSVTKPVVAWVQFLNGVLMCAREKQLYEIRGAWMQSETFMQKMMRTHDQLDMFTEDQVEGRRTNYAEAVNHTHAMGRTSFLIPTDKPYHFFPSRCRLRCTVVIDPQSPYRITWMSIGMLLMLYDLVMLPMIQVFTLKDEGFLRVMQWFGQIFWTVDIGVCFVTGVYIDSELVTNLLTIARVYASTWLFFDLVVVAPLWVVEFMGNDSDASGAEKSTSIFKYVRMLRFLRLARLAKFEHYLQEALASINSSALLLCFGIAKLMSMLIISNHINACLWYAVGTAEPGGWAQAYSQTDIPYKYLTSMHWAITQFQGTSEITPVTGGGRGTFERAFAVMTVVFALIILASFVSTLTNMILQLQQLREERTGMQRMVRAYLCDNKISLQLSLRVKKYIDWKQRAQRKFADNSMVTKLLPVAMQMDLTDEVCAPMLAGNPFFEALSTTHSRSFRSICFEGLHTTSPAPGELIFKPFDECHQMYFVAAGHMRYLPPLKQRRGGGEVNLVDIMTRHPVHEDCINLYRIDYLCEAVLWTHWEHCGALIGLRDSSLFTLTERKFVDLIKQHPPAHASAVLYARLFIAGLNRFGKNYDDYISQETFEQDFKHISAEA